MSTLPSNLHANGSCSHEEEQYTLNPHKRLRPHLVDLCHRFSRDCMLHLSFVMVTLNDYFSHKNEPCPPSLSAGGKLKLGTKSDNVRCLEDAPEKHDGITPNVDVVMLDGPGRPCCES